MPGKLTSKLQYTFIFSILFFLGFGSSWLVSNSHVDETVSKRTLAKIKNNTTAPMEKHLMPIALSVQGPDAFPNDPQSIVQLKAIVRTPFSQFTAIHYQWILPDDVTIIKGYPSGDIQNPVANQTYEVELLVKGFNNLDRKDISIVATTQDMNGTRLGNSAVITSRPADSMEHLAPVMMIKAQEFKTSQAHERMPASKDEQ